MSILQICGIAVAAAASALIIKQLGASFGAAAAISGAIILFAASLGKYREAVSVLKDISAKSGIGEFGGLMVKALGIGVTVKIASDICRDCGEEGIAGGLEAVGKLEILMLCLPYIVELVKLTSELVP